MESTNLERVSISIPLIKLVQCSHFRHTLYIKHIHTALKPKAVARESHYNLYVIKSRENLLRFLMTIYISYATRIVILYFLWDSKLVIESKMLLTLYTHT